MLRDLDREILSLLLLFGNQKQTAENSPYGKREIRTILIQGSGTYGVEAVVGSTTPPNGKALVIVNGAYGKRIKQIADILKLKRLL